MSLIEGDCIEVMATMEEASVDAIVTDPPYGIGFMGRKWDGLPPGVEWATQCLRVLKPGGHLLAFGGTRTYHRLTCAIEDAGFEVRDCLAWLYGSGFPKSLDVGKAIDKAAGAEREVVGPRRWDGRAPRGTALGRMNDDAWEAKPDAANPATAPATPEAAEWDGWGTALKPAHEPIVLARKPLAGTVAGNVLEHGTGALNVGGCRIGSGARPARSNERSASGLEGTGGASTYGSFAVRGSVATGETTEGRWPANVLLDEEAAGMLDEQSGTQKSGVAVNRNRQPDTMSSWMGTRASQVGDDVGYGDSGGASRFFYCAKASRRERGEDNTHPTVKPLKLMRWLCRLVTPPGGLILDPFAGSGTTGIAAAAEDFRFIGIEREPEYVAIANRRLAA